MSARGNVAAFSYLQVWRAYQGRAYGQIADPPNVSANTTSHAYLMRDGITAGIPQIQREVASFRGGGKPLGTMQLGISEIGAFDISLATYDATLRALVNGSNVDTTSITNVTVSASNIMRADTPQIGIMLTTRFQSRATGGDGDNKWMSVIMLGQGDLMLPEFSQDGGTNPSPATLRFTPTLTNKFPTGVALGTNQGLEDNRTEALVLVSEYPMALTTFIADGTATQYILGYRPKYSTVTNGVTNQQIAINNTATAPTSVNTTTGVVVIAAAGSSGDYHAALYQTAFVAI